MSFQDLLPTMISGIQQLLISFILYTPELLISLTRDCIFTWLPFFNSIIDICIVNKFPSSTIRNLSWLEKVWDQALFVEGCEHCSLRYSTTYQGPIWKNITDFNPLFPTLQKVLIGWYLAISIRVSVRAPNEQGPGTALNLCKAVLDGFVFWYSFLDVIIALFYRGNRDNKNVVVVWQANSLYHLYMLVKMRSKIAVWRGDSFTVCFKEKWSHCYLLVVDARGSRWGLSFNNKIST